MAMHQLVLERTARKISHNHYFYTFKFNNISLYHTMVSCNLQDQSEVIDYQKKCLDESKGNGFNKIIEEGRYLAYTNKECCIEVSSVEPKRASDATSKREFSCRDVPLQEMIPDLHSPHPYITDDSISEIFDPKVVSANMIDKTFMDIQSHLYTTVCSSLGLSLAGSNPSEIGKHLGDSLQGVMKNVVDKHQHLLMASREINYELPYNDWLHKHLVEQLSPFGFIVDRHAKLLKPVAPVNEFITSQPDIVIYHGEKYMKHLNAIYVKPVVHNLDVLCFNEEEAIGQVKMLGFAGELKLCNIGDETDNECYYNMFGQGISLAMKAISNGQLVQKVSMYGISVAVQNRHAARLLHISMDFNNGKSTFTRAQQVYDFVYLLNKILKMLSQD